MKTHSVSSEVPTGPGKRCSLADSFQGLPTILRRKLALPTEKAEVLAPPGPLPSFLLPSALRASCPGGASSSPLLASRRAGQWKHCENSEGRRKVGVLCLGHHGSGPSHHCQFHAVPCLPVSGNCCLSCPAASLGRSLEPAPT